MQISAAKVGLVGKEEALGREGELGLLVLAIEEFGLPILFQTKPCSVVPARSDCLCRGSLWNVLDGISSRYCEDQVSHSIFNCQVLISFVGFRR